MKINDDIVKRFQFDLKMGRFNVCKNEYSDTNKYCFCSKNPLKVMLFVIFLKIGLGFESTSSINEIDFGICVEPINREFWFYDEEEYDPNADNPIPDYIKEFIKNGD